MRKDLWDHIYQELSVGTFLQNMAFYSLIAILVLLNSWLMKMARDRQLKLTAKKVNA